MKYLFSVFIMILPCIIYSQISIGIFKSGDHLVMNNTPTISWSIRKGNSSGLWLTHPISKNLEIGGIVRFGEFDLLRPDNSYNLKYTTVGIALSDSRFIWKRFRSDSKIYSFLRNFDTELFSSSLVVDDINYGVGLNVGIHNNFYKNWDLGISVTKEWDLLRGAIDSDEITQKDKFIKLTITSFSIELKYRFKKSPNP